MSFTIFLGVSIAYALDYPHFDVNNIGCDSCHFIYGTEPGLLPPWTAHTPTDIDDTQSNTLCWSCHNDVDAPYVRTHSSLQTDNGYGDWSIECKTCHNPHYQKQADTHGSASYLYSGTSTDVTAATLTETGAGWTVNEYQGLVVIPNTAQMKYKYKITGNTNETLTIDGPVNLTKAATGNTFAIVYGKLVNSTINTPSSGGRTVKFFDESGTNSFADGDSTYDGVCEICHTQTVYHQNDSTGNHSHNVGVDCITCHTHTDGFAGTGCTECHGLPPVDAGTLVFNPPGGTGSATAGAHEVHVITKGFDCSSCHYDSAGAGGSHNNSITITIGYSLFGGTYQGGSYDGQSGVSYNTTTTIPPTTVSNTGSNTCSSIYCHSTGQSVTDENDPSPEYASPVWDDSSSAVCGTCHKVSEAAGLTSGSHAVHLGTTGVNGCGDCHTGAADNASSYSSSNHVNASIDVANSYSAGGAPGNGYGTCSAASCHDDGTGNPAVTPQWGSSPTPCTACHAEIPGTGSHQKHVTTTQYNKADCGDCHDSAVQGSIPPSQHLDNNIDVYEAAAGDLGYPTDKVKGSAYAACSLAYCHSTGQSTSDGNSSIPTYAEPIWGSTSAVCGTCHKVSEASGLTSGSHGEHLGSTGVNGCGDCHTGAANDASSYNSVIHVDGFIDVDNTYSAVGAPGNGYGTCDTASCHDDGTGTMVTTPAWGTSPPACTACHAAAPVSGSHSEHLAESGIACADCHDSAVQGTTAPAQHLDDNIDVYDSAAGDLGYPQDKVKGSAYTNCTTASCHDDGTGTLVATPDWGTTVNDCSECHALAPATGSHTKHLSGTLYSTAACADCHDNAVQGTTAPSQHLDGNIDVYYSAAGDLGYPQDVEKGGSPYDSCSTVYCHSTGQSTTDKDSSAPSYAPVTWGGTAPCGSCHKVTEASGLTSGSHAAHLGSSGVSGCSDCHTGAADDASAYNSTDHVNASIDVSNTYTAGGAPGNDYGSCTTNCHGSTSDIWGTDLSAYDTCTKCHGEHAATPTDAQKAPGGSGVDTNGDSAPTDTQVGAHQVHMTLSSGYTNQLNASGNCSECHLVPSAAGDSGHIDSALPAEVFPGTINPDKADLYGVTPAYSGGVCTVYCHGANMPGGTTGGSDTSPAWNDTTLLTGTPSLAGDCGVCHGAPPLNSPHTGSETINECDTCHTHLNNDGTFADASLHINGAVNAVSDCDSCHAYPPAPGDGKAYQAVEGKGAHSAHVTHLASVLGVTLNASSDSYAGNTVCGVCHDVSSDTKHNNGTRDIAISATYQFGSSAPAYNGVVGTAGATTAKTCSNMSCHFKITPEWEAY